MPTTPRGSCPDCEGEAEGRCAARLRERPVDAPSSQRRQARREGLKLLSAAKLTNAELRTAVDFYFEGLTTREIANHPWHDTTRRMIQLRLESVRRKLSAAGVDLPEPEPRRILPLEAWAQSA
jgi:hypothetical protein